MQSGSSDHLLKRPTRYTDKARVLGSKSLMQCEVVSLSLDVNLI